MCCHLSFYSLCVCLLELFHFQRSLEELPGSPSWLTACLCVCVCSAKGMFFCPSVQLVLWLCFPSHFLPAAAWLLLFLADTTQHTLTYTHTHTLLVLVPVTVRLSIWLLFRLQFVGVSNIKQLHARTRAHTDTHAQFSAAFFHWQPSKGFVHNLYLGCLICIV